MDVNKNNYDQLQVTCGLVLTVEGRDCLGMSPSG